jgi:hypothetical protein
MPDKYYRQTLQADATGKTISKCQANATGKNNQQMPDKCHRQKQPANTDSKYSEQIPRASPPLAATSLSPTYF